MKRWIRGLAMALTAAMLLAALTACGPSGPSTPEQPGSSGSSGTGTEQPGKDPGTGEAGGTGSGETSGETGSGSESEKDPEEKPGGTGKDDKEDENTPKTEEQKAIEATIKALNTVRAEYGNKQPLTPNAEACAIATQMAQVMQDGVNGKYGEEPNKNTEYKDACSNVRGQMVQGKACTGFGALRGAYPDAGQYRKWAVKTGSVSAERNKALVLSEETTLVGVGVVQNPDKNSEYKYMVVVMTY